MRERFSFQVLQNQKVDSVLLAYVKQCANMRMRKLRYRAGFPFESLPELGVFCKTSWKNLDRHRPAQTGVRCQVDFSHAARASDSKNFVGPEPGSNSYGHS